MAAEDVKPKKRKGAADAAPKPKKQKKTEDTVNLAKAITSAENVPESAPSKRGRKRAADFFVDDSVANEETVKVKKPKKKKKEPAEINGALDNAAEALEPLIDTKTKSKKQKKAAKEDAELELEPAAEAPKEATKKSKKVRTQVVEGAEAAPPKKSKKAKDVVEETEAAPVEKPKKASKKQKPVKEPTPEVDSGLDAEELDDEDQTAALLAGFESDEDENDPEADEDFSEVAKVAIDKKTEKQLAKAGKNSSNPGVVYVGRIPHGFFEPQMKAYFSQFGTVTNLRLSRNKKTGASKHYAFVEFASEEVADIVARTMDKYLLFGHILQCKVIPSEQIHENLFDGANRRFKTMPRNKMAGLQMARGAEREQWEKRVKLEKKKRNAKNKKLKEEFGYEFTALALKSVDDVPKKTPALENGETEQLLIVARTENVGDPGDETVDPKAKKAKKTKNSAKADVEGNPAVDLAEEAPVVKEKKAKKEKKPKAEVLTAADGEGTDRLVPEVKTKTKSKKTNVVEVAPASDVPIKEKKRKVTTIEQDAVKIKKVKKVKA